MGNIVVTQCNLNLHARRHILAQHFDNITLCLKTCRWPVGNCHFDQLAYLRTAGTPWADQHFLLHFLIVGEDKANAIFFVIASHNRLMRTHHDFSNRTFTTTALIKAYDAT